VMRASGGKANPQAVNDLLKRKLEIWAGSAAFARWLPRSRGTRMACCRRRDRSSAARRGVSTGARGDGRARITVADSAFAASNLRRESVLRPNFQNFFSPGSNPQKSPRELVSTMAQAVRARAEGVEKIHDGVEKPLCDTAFLHSMWSDTCARSWTRCLLEVAHRAWPEASEALGGASRLSTIR
jgi:hypothetical protein